MYFLAISTGYAYMLCTLETLNQFQLTFYLWLIIFNSSSLADNDRVSDDLSFALKTGLLYMQDPINKVQ